MALPELPAADVAAIYVHTESGRLGPLTRAEIAGRLQAGTVRGSDLFWFKGMADWAPVGSRADLAPSSGPRSVDRSPSLVSLERAVTSPERAVTSAERAAANAASERATADRGLVGVERAVSAAQHRRGQAPTERALDRSEAAAGPAESGREAPSGQDADPDATFARLVRASWDRHHEHFVAAHIDEVFLGAVIAVVVELGWSLIDVASDGTHHYLRFEQLERGDRVVVRSTHLTPDLALSRAIGHRAQVVVGYGERIEGFAAVLQALKSEFKSGLLDAQEPGVITTDVDIGAQYVYCQVGLLLDLGDYVDRELVVQSDRLSADIDASLFALRKYLSGRFGGRVGA